MLEIAPVHSEADYRDYHRLAALIIPEVYTGTIDVPHLEFFVERFHAPKQVALMQQEGYEMYLFRTEGASVGYLCIQERLPSLFISKFYFLSDWRGKGLGQVVLRFLEQEARKRGCQQLELFVSIDNRKGIAFYEREGFTQFEKVVSRYESGYAYEDYRMIKPIG